MLQLKSEQYPVCSLDSGGFSPEPAVFVVFGATGDLSHRKIFPALFDLYLGGILPDDLLMVGFARKDLDHKRFREGLRQGCASFARAGAFNEEQWKKFSSRVFYLRSDLNEPEGYVRLADVLTGREIGFFKGFDAIPKNILFYLAVGPEHF